VRRWEGRPRGTCSEGNYSSIQRSGCQRGRDRAVGLIHSRGFRPGGLKCKGVHTGRPVTRRVVRVSHDYPRQSTLRSPGVKPRARKKPKNPGTRSFARGVVRNPMLQAENPAALPPPKRQLAIVSGPTSPWHGEARRKSPRNRSAVGFHLQPQRADEESKFFPRKRRAPRTLEDSFRSTPPDTLLGVGF